MPSSGGLVVAFGAEIDRQRGLTMTFEFGNGEAYGALMGTVYYLDGGAFATVTIVAMAYWIGMFVVLQGLTGRTGGKILTRICTVDAAGRPCGIGRATVRWLFLVVDAFPYFVPMLVGFIVTVSSRTPEGGRPGRKDLGGQRRSARSADPDGTTTSYSTGPRTGPRDAATQLAISGHLHAFVQPSQSASLACWGDRRPVTGPGPCDDAIWITRKEVG